MQQQRGFWRREVKRNFTSQLKRMSSKRFMQTTNVHPIMMLGPDRSRTEGNNGAAALLRLSKWLIPAVWFQKLYSRSSSASRTPSTLITTDIGGRPLLVVTLHTPRRKLLHIQSFYSVLWHVMTELIDKMSSKRPSSAFLLKRLSKWLLKQLVAN